MDVLLPPRGFFGNGHCRRVVCAFLVMMPVSPALLAEPSASSAAAETANNEGEPLWQLGVGAGAIRLPYYPGSRETNSYAFPVIYPIYRGEYLKADEDGVRGELFANRRWQLEVSLDFNFSVDSDEVSVREGMSDLPATLQVGPLLKYHAIDREDLNLWLQLPLRAVVSGEDLDIGYEGFLVNPRVVLEKSFHSRWGLWRWSHSLGLNYGSEDYHRFYYDVAPRFATTERPLYRSDAGYSGARYQMVLSRPGRTHLFSMFMRYGNTSGAEFQDSPLATDDATLAVGFVYSYFFLNSTTRVVPNPNKADH